MIGVCTKYQRLRVLCFKCEWRRSHRFCSVTRRARTYGGMCSLCSGFDKRLFLDWLIHSVLKSVHLPFTPTTQNSISVNSVNTRSQLSSLLYTLFTNYSMILFTSLRLSLYHTRIESSSTKSNNAKKIALFSSSCPILFYVPWCGGLSLVGDTLGATRTVAPAPWWVDEKILECMIVHDAVHDMR